MSDRWAALNRRIEHMGDPFDPAGTMDKRKAWLTDIVEDIEKRYPNDPKRMDGYAMKHWDGYVFGRTEFDDGQGVIAELTLYGSLEDEDE